MTVALCGNDSCSTVLYGVFLHEAFPCTACEASQEVTLLIHTFVLHFQEQVELDQPEW